MDFKAENIKALDKNKVYAIKVKFSGIVSKEVLRMVKEKITDDFEKQGISVIILVADYHFDSELLGPIDIDKKKLVELLR